MAEHSRIEWTDATWNPVTGCTLVSEGCRNCYAAELAAGRLRHHPSRQGLARRNADGVAAFTGEVRLNEEWLTLPLRWRRPRRIFVCAHGDLFHEAVPDEWIDRVFAVMALSPRHVFQVLTKRPERMRDYFRLGLRHQRICSHMDAITGGDEMPPTLPLPNVWLGVSAEDQATADARIPPLLETPAAVRFLSAEPLLGPIDLTAICWRDQDAEIRANVLSAEAWVDNSLSAAAYSNEADGMTRLDWVIAGGESGRHARPMHPDWARSLRDQCQGAGVPFVLAKFVQRLERPPLLEEEFRDAGMTAAEPRLRALLADVLGVLYHDAGDLIETCSLSERDGEERIPREGSLDPDARDQVEELLALIRRIEAEGVKPVDEQPAWLIAIVEKRREL